MKKFTMTQLNLAAWAGIIAPALFVVVFSIEGWLRPGYNALRTFVSALSLGPRGWIQIANFLLFGLLFFIFTRSVASQFQSGKASRGGIALLTVIAFCFFFSGPFVMDPVSIALNQATIHGTFHGILGAIAFLLMPISMFVYLRRFNDDPNWTAMRGWTLVLGSISAAALVILTIVTKFQQFQSAFANWFGLIQRALIIPFMIWTFVLALNLLGKIRARG
jgi:hypothetical protein